MEYGKTEGSELNGSRNFPNSICSYFFHEFRFAKSRKPVKSYPKAKMLLTE